MRLLNEEGKVLLIRNVVLSDVTSTRQGDDRSINQDHTALIYLFGRGKLNNISNTMVVFKYSKIN